MSRVTAPASRGFRRESNPLAGVSSWLWDSLEYEVWRVGEGVGGRSSQRFPAQTTQAGAAAP